MLTFKNQIHNLSEYKSEFTEKEKEQLSQCFTKIQEYIRASYMNTTSRGIVLFHLHDNDSSHSCLVIDFITGEIYLSHRGHSVIGNSYFCRNESVDKYWKYILCLIVVENWPEIKETLNNYFKNMADVSELCSNFRV